MSLLDVLKEVNLESTYRVLRNTPDIKGNTLSHSDAKRILDLSDGNAEFYRARLDAGVEIVGDES